MFFLSLNASNVFHWITELVGSVVEVSGAEDVDGVNRFCSLKGTSPLISEVVVELSEVVIELSGAEDVDGVDRFCSLKGISPLISEVVGSNVGAGVVEMRKGVEDGVGQDSGVVLVDNWSGSEDSECTGVDNRCGVVDDEGGDVVGVDNLCGVDVGNGVVDVSVDSKCGSDDVVGGVLHKQTFVG